MKKKIKGYVKLQIQAGKATPAPPVGPALGQWGINIAAFTKQFNDMTKDKDGLMMRVLITIYEDKSFSFVIKSSPASVLIKKACKIEKGSGVPNKTKVAVIKKEDVKKIAEEKMKDLNADTIESAMNIIIGSCKSMGIEIES